MLYILDGKHYFINEGLLTSKVDTSIMAKTEVYIDDVIDFVHDQ